MASFTSEIVNYNPYVQQIPDSYYQVGMLKQQQYDQGVATIQNQLSSVAGIEVLKGSHRDYLNARVNELATHLNKMPGTTDFSDASFVNQIGGYATRLASDPIIQNAAAAAATHKKQMQYIEEARKKGEDTTRNEWDYNKQLSEWLNDGDIKSSFNGRFSPVVDVMGEFYKAFKEAHPSSSLNQDAFEMNSEGKITYKSNAVIEEVEKEGIDPSTVQSIANLVFSRADVKNQIRIDGQYAYRGFSQENLSESVRRNYQASLEATNRDIQALRSKMITDKTVNKSQVADLIEKRKLAGAKIVSDYTDFASLIASDPEAAKAALYQNNLMSNVINSFSWMKEKRKIIENPVFAAEIKIKEFNLNLAKFEWDKKKDIAEIDLKKEELRLKKEKEESDKKTGGASVIIGEKNVAEEQGKVGYSSFMEGLVSRRAEYADVAAESVRQLATYQGVAAPKIKDNQGRWVWNEEAYGSASKAEAQFNKIFQDADNAYRTGKSTDKVNEIFDRLDLLKRRVVSAEDFIKKTESRFGQAFKDVPSVVHTIRNDASATRDFKKGYTVSTADLIDLAVVNHGEVGPQRNEAIKRLNKKFGEIYGSSSGSLSLERTLNSRSPEAKKTYDAIVSKLNLDNKALNSFTAREDAYKAAQLAYSPKQVNVNTVDEKTTRATTNAFVTALSELKVGNESSVIEDMLNWTKDEKEGKTKDNLYGGYYNKFSGKAYLTITRGTETKEVEVPLNVYESTLGIKTNDAFWEAHGDDLAVSGNTTTNYDQGGMASAYRIRMPQGSEYDVRYHLVSVGDNLYEMQLYATDSKGNLILPGVRYELPGIGGQLSGEQVMAARETLKKSAVIEGLVEKTKK